MRVGYACVNTQLPSASRTLRLANLSEERLRELIAANLDALEAILRWNIEHELFVFRLSSETVPFGSHEANTLRWREELTERFAALGTLMRDAGMGISTHPGQFTVLGSPGRSSWLRASPRWSTTPGCSRRSSSTRRTRSSCTEAASTGTRAAAERFALAFEQLSPSARARLVLENDERWSLEDVLTLAGQVGQPVVFDAFHHELRPSLPKLSVRDAVLLARETWGAAEGRQEVHFSTQASDRRPGAHAETVDLDAFARFADEVGDLELDCVIEVKDKERSALRASALLADRVRA